MKLVALVLTLCTGTLPAQSPRLSVAPKQPAPGSLVRLTVITPSGADSISSITGRMGGEPLHFTASSAGVWRSIGPIPVDAVDSVVARVLVTRASGAVDSVDVAALLPRPPRRTGAARRRSLAVAPRFTRPLDAETQARSERENARAREIGRRSHETPKLWTAPFLRPRATAVTSRFGTGRMFNGTVASRHLGVDFSGAVGTPIRAANRGVVALVDEFFLAGNVVYIDHGEGVVTGCFHLSEALVATGDTVSRGQEIGRVGATGRVTGPHLHWSARYGALTVNPLDLVSLSVTGP